MKKTLVLFLSVFLLLAVPASVFQLRQGVQLGETFYVRKNADFFRAKQNSIAIERSEGGAMFMISVGNTRMNVEMSKADERYTFAYDDGTVVEGYANEWSNELASADGAPLMWTDGIAVYVGAEPPEDDILQRKYSLSNDLFQMYEGICERKGHFMLLVMGTLMYALGVSSVLWPEKVHFMGNRWRYSHAELSDEGIAMQKLSGFVCIVISGVMLYLPFFL